jgi:hypothetical protein
MSDDYKIQSAYEGPECYAVKNETMHNVGLQLPKPKHNLVFTNSEGHEVGTLDFDGPGLAFEGVANESAIVFMDWISKVFQQRLKDEYDRGFKDGKSFGQKRIKS